MYRSISSAAASSILFNIIITHFFWRVIFMRRSILRTLCRCVTHTVFMLIFATDKKHEQSTYMSIRVNQFILWIMQRSQSL